MKHASTRELFAYWNGRRGARVAPERAEIDPGAIRTALGDTFLLASAPDGGHTFRLAGTRVCALFGRELKGECFISLWEDADRAAARSLLRIVATEMVGVVAGAAGHSSEGAGGPRVAAAALAPLRTRRQASDRRACPARCAVLDRRKSAAPAAPRRVAAYRDRACPQARRSGIARPSSARARRP